MGLENAGWHQVRYRAFDRVLDSQGFACIRNSAHDGSTFHDLADAHRDSLFGHLCQTGEPAFAYLLLAAGRIQVDDDVWIFGLEVSGRIVEGQMAIFSDADAGHINAYAVDQFPQPLALRLRISFTI